MCTRAPILSSIFLVNEYNFCLKDAAVESLTTVKPYSNEIHAQAQLWLKKDPKASYEAWKKCLPARCKCMRCLRLDLILSTVAAIITQLTEQMQIYAHSLLVSS